MSYYKCKTTKSKANVARKVQTSFEVLRPTSILKTNPTIFNKSRTRLPINTTSNFTNRHTDTLNSSGLWPTISSVDDQSFGHSRSVYSNEAPPTSSKFDEATQRKFAIKVSKIQEAIVGSSHETKSVNIETPESII